MKTATHYTILMLIVFVFINVSCKKNVDAVLPETIDSIQSVLPKQVVLVEDLDTLVTISFKYDNVNHKVELYEDNPSTPGIFDKLLITSTFNNDGYLIGYIVNTDKFYYAGFDNAIININRASDNKINYIAYNDRQRNEKDTTYYTYESVNDHIKIVVKGNQSYFEGSTTNYIYDKNNKLLSYNFSYGQTEDVRFFYNPNNSLIRVVKTGGALDNVAEFSYTSGLPDDKEDMLGRLLFGKDHYLWDLKSLSPFTIYLDADFDDFPIPLTDPYHFTRMQDTHKATVGDPTEIEGYNVVYELNQNKLLSKVTFIDDENYKEIALFKY